MPEGMGMTMGQQAASSAIQEGVRNIFSLGLGGIYNRRQIKQQRRLNALENEQTIFNRQQQEELWRNTSYGPQKDLMKEAGINPALMYGMGGGGGQTAAVSTGGHSNAGEGFQAQSQMGINFAMQKAQIDLLNAQTKKTEVEAEKTAGVDTQEANTRIDALLQGIDNARQQNELQKLEITLKNIENFEKQSSQGDRLDYIMYQTRIAEKQWEIAQNEAYISSATRKEKVDIIKAEAIGAVLRNLLTEAQTTNTKQNTAASQQQIKESIQRIMRDWDGLSVQQQEQQLRQMLMNYNTDPTNDHVKEAIRALGGILHMGDNSPWLQSKPKDRAPF